LKDTANNLFGKRFIAILFVFTFLLLFSFTLGANNVTNNKPKKLQYKEGELIVKFKKDVSVSKSANIHKMVAAKVKRRLRLIGADHVILPEGMSVEEALAKYKADPNVEYAEPNYKVRKAAITPNDTEFSKQWGLKKIEAEKAWDYSQGSSDVIVAVLDTGIDYNHPDLKDNIWINQTEICDNNKDDDGNGKVDDCKGWNFDDNNNDPMDDDIDGSGSHGTHVAGIIGAVGNNNFGVAGVSWNVKLMAVKVLDNHGSGYISDIVAGIDYARNNGAKILNLSLEAEEDVSGINSLKDAIANARDCLFVVAAGNGGLDLDKNNIYPASYKLPNLISVSATDENDKKASFSNYGVNTVHLAAPGVGIISTKSKKAPGFNNYTTAFFYETGTSMAAPFVTGVAALLKAKYPSYTYRDIKESILASVDKLNLAVITRGRLNAYKAITVDLNTVPPVAPENFTFAETPSAGAPIKLQWVDVSSKETGYNLERNLKNSGYSFLVTLPSDTTSYTDNISLQEGDMVAYKLYAVNSNGKSEPAILEFQIPLKAPTNLVVTKISGGFRLTWQDNTSNEDGYEIWRQSGINNYEKIATVGKDVTVYDDTNLTSESFYYYKVRAYNNQGVYSVFSNEAFTQSSNSSTSSSSKKCFIATAAYGTPYHPHIDVLRDFRDKYLLKSALGRSFVMFYYSYSPYLADIISKSILLRAMALALILPVVYLIKFPLLFLLIGFLTVVAIFKKRRFIEL